MITLFTIPKHFEGLNNIIQINAIRSWTMLAPTCEIILMGDDRGTAETACDLGLRHIPYIRRNRYGTPLLNDMFDKARRMSANNFLCYVNADIILMSDFMTACRKAIAHGRRCVFGKHHFLMCGRRWNIEQKTFIDFDAHWEAELKKDVQKRGYLFHITAIDYFVYPKKLFEEMPAFAIGRTAWDNWLLYYARRKRAKLINATSEVMAVHQNHDYNHCQKGKTGAFKGPESVRNKELAGGPEYLYTLEDATHELDKNGLRALSPEYRHFKRRYPTLYGYSEKHRTTIWRLVSIMAIFRKIFYRLSFSA